ncbi:hypothetical protein EVAR_51908_1 [Eumeta japonica]|uniref:Uncharacterized protein n=1 Tax=Eumeta variegata TaxID=151549 RepID=A0A4C1XI72_EUMVA|nr:hypothetical protein EVAR_51908_1 [Eumeta japonica]
MDSRRRTPFQTILPPNHIQRQAFRNVNDPMVSGQLDPLDLRSDVAYLRMLHRVLRGVPLKTIQPSSCHWLRSSFRSPETPSAPS